MAQNKVLDTIASLHDLLLLHSDHDSDVVRTLEDLSRQTKHRLFSDQRLHKLQIGFEVGKRV